MIVVSGSSHPLLAHNVARNLQCGYIIPNMRKFADQQLNINIEKNLRDEEVIILQSTNTPVYDNLMELLLLANTVKRSGAKRITAVIPYYAYGRQDKDSTLSANLVPKLIATSGVDDAIMIDMHSPQSEIFFTIPIKNLHTQGLFAHQFIKNSTYDGCERYTIISPDKGSVSRASMLAKTLNADLAIMHKRRSINRVCDIWPITGDIQDRDCIVIDDMIDTGETLYAVAMFARRRAKSLSVCITHAVFSTECLEKIRCMGLEKFFVTDTIYHRTLPPFVTVIETSQLIAQSLSDHFL